MKKIRRAIVILIILFIVNVALLVINLTKAYNNENNLVNNEAESKQGVTAGIPEFSCMKKLPDISVHDENTKKEVFPRLYGQLDSLATIVIEVDEGNALLEVSAEIEDFTQKYSETVYVRDKERVELLIKPNLLKRDISLDSYKDTYFHYKVEDSNTGNVIKEENIPIKLMGDRDIINYDSKNKELALHNYLSFLTPESGVVDEIIGNAAHNLVDLSKGKYNGFAGYQYDKSVQEDATYYQILAIEKTISDMGVLYDSGNYTSGNANENLQKVRLPYEVYESKLGNCVELSLLLSSILVNERMHCFLLFFPGHCQVAVETGKNTGEYFIVETTMLQVTNKMKLYSDYDGNKIDSLITYMNREGLYQYLTANDIKNVIDCDMADVLGFQYVNDGNDF
ncbi:MAG: hypothetical protein MJ133_03345 [Lachnospiraceae bacterium]|nr:hypothetical protein [Lachnospiraceae bacterium]